MNPSPIPVSTDERSRRSFLGAALTATGAVLSARGASAAEDAPLEIVDTHQHLWDLTTQKLAWLGNAPDVLKHSYGQVEYAKATEGLNVTRAVYMEVDVIPEQQQAEADLLIGICRKGQSPTVAAVISGRPGGEAFAGYIRPLAKNPEIKGVRQVLHEESAVRGLCLQPQYVKSMKLLGELGLSFDLCMRPTELSDGVRLAKTCPDTRFIVDHCGNGDAAAFLKPGSGDAKPATHEPQQWRDDIAALADCPNVICKISGVIARAPRGIPFAESLAPMVNHCLDRFGPERVIFGGDWPVCLLGGSYRDWVTSLKQMIGNRPVDQQCKLLSENAVRFYRL